MTKLVLERVGRSRVRVNVKPKLFNTLILTITKPIMLLVLKNTSYLQSILSVNEKLPVPKFGLLGKYMIQLDSYIYVHLSGQRQTGLEENTSSTSLGTMVHVMHVLFVFFAVFIKQHARTCPRRFH